MTTEEAYRILELRPPVDAQQVKSAYRRKALECHPDRVVGEDEKALQSRRFMRAREAYEQLRQEGFPELQAEPVPEPDFGPKIAGRSFAPAEPLESGAVEKLGLGVAWKPESVVVWGIGLPAAVGFLVYVVKHLLDAIRGG